MVVSVALVTQLRELFLLVFVYLEQNTGINVLAVDCGC